MSKPTEHLTSTFISTDEPSKANHPKREGWKQGLRTNGAAKFWAKPAIAPKAKKKETEPSDLRASNTMIVRPLIFLNYI